MLALYTEQAMVFYEPERRSRFGPMRILSMASHDQTLVGTEDGFALAIADLPRRRTLFEEIYRSEPQEPGEVHRWGS